MSKSKPAASQPEDTQKDDEEQTVDEEQASSSTRKQEKGASSSKRSRFVAEHAKNKVHPSDQEIIGERNLQSPSNFTIPVKIMYGIQRKSKYTSPVKIIYTRKAKKAVDSGWVPYVQFISFPCNKNGRRHVSVNELIGRGM